MKIQKKMQSLLAILMAAVLCVGMLPTTVFADEEAPAPEDPPSSNSVWVDYDDWGGSAYIKVGETVLSRNQNYDISDISGKIINLKSPEDRSEETPIVELIVHDGHMDADEGTYIPDTRYFSDGEGASLTVTGSGRDWSFTAPELSGDNSELRVWWSPFDAFGYDDSTEVQVQTNVCSEASSGSITIDSGVTIKESDTESEYGCKYNILVTNAFGGDENSTFGVTFSPAEGYELDFVMVNDTRYRVNPPQGSEDSDINGMSSGFTHNEDGSYTYDVSVGNVKVTETDPESGAEITRYNSIYFEANFVTPGGGGGEGGEGGDRQDLQANDFRVQFSDYGKADAVKIGASSIQNGYKGNFSNGEGGYNAISLSLAAPSMPGEETTNISVIVNGNDEVGTLNNGVWSYTPTDSSPLEIQIYWSSEERAFGEFHAGDNQFMIETNNDRNGTSAPVIAVAAANHKSRESADRYIYATGTTSVVFTLTPSEGEDLDGIRIDDVDKTVAGAQSEGILSAKSEDGKYTFTLNTSSFNEGDYKWIEFRFTDRNSGGQDDPQPPQPTQPPQAGEVRFNTRNVPEGGTISVKVNSGEWTALKDIDFSTLTNGDVVYVKAPAAPAGSSFDSGYCEIQVDDNRTAIDTDNLVAGTFSFTYDSSKTYEVRIGYIGDLRVNIRVYTDAENPSGPNGIDNARQRYLTGTSIDSADITELFYEDGTYYVSIEPEWRFEDQACYKFAGIKINNESKQVQKTLGRNTYEVQFGSGDAITVSLEMTETHIYTIMWANDGANVTGTDWDNSETKIVNGSAYVYKVYENATNMKDISSEIEGTDTTGCVDENGRGYIKLEVGNVVEFKFVPKYGHQLVAIAGNGQPGDDEAFDINAQDDINVYRFIMPDGNVHFYAQFAEVDDEVKTDSRDLNTDGNSIVLADNEIADGTVQLIIGDSQTNVFNSKASREGYEVTSLLGIGLNQVFYKGSNDSDNVWENPIGHNERLNGKATITLSLNYEVKSGNVKILHEYGAGLIEVIDATVNGDGTVSFETDSFSNYAVCKMICRHTGAKNKKVTKEFLASPANCTTPATYYYECADCYEALTETYTNGVALGHTVVTDSAVEATCTTSGKTAGSHCSVCTTVLSAQENVPAKGHTVVTDSAVAATCTTAGKTAGSHCSVCSVVLSAQETVPAKGHTVVTDSAVEATCTTAGKTAGSHCSVCTTVLSAQETVPAKGHTEVEDSAVAATCTTAGKTAGKHCSTCSIILEEQSVVPATGHTLETKISKTATAKSDGEEKTFCTKCNAVTAKKVISKANIVCDETQKYTGKAIKPIKILDSKGKAINKNYYTIKYKNNKNVGKATATITFKGNYSGKVTKTFTIVKQEIIPGKVSGLKLTAAKKGFKVSWSAGTENADGYEIKYSTDKNFLSKDTKIVKISKADTVTKSISKLKSKKTYYVQIRAYNKDGKTTAYSAWSASKSVKTK